LYVNAVADTCAVKMLSKLSSGIKNFMIEVMRLSLEEEVK